jgi:hypothetical protein
MRFQGLFTSAQPADAAGPAPLGLMEKVSRLMDEALQAGLPAVECDASAAARVKLSGGEFIVTRAPNSQPSPGVSYAMFDVDSIVEAILWTKCFLQVLGEGECEIRPVCAA